MDHKDRLFQPSFPQPTQYPSLKHQQAFTGNTPPQRVRETGKLTESLHHCLQPAKSLSHSQVCSRTPVAAFLASLLPSPRSSSYNFPSPFVSLSQLPTTASPAKKPGRMSTDSIFSLCSPVPVSQSYLQLCNRTPTVTFLPPLPIPAVDPTDLPLLPSLTPTPLTIYPSHQVQQALPTNTQTTAAGVFLCDS